VAPFGTWLALIMFLIVIFFANISVFQSAPFSWFDFITG
jgi:hypothetical protein